MSHAYPSFFFVAAFFLSYGHFYHFLLQSHPGAVLDLTDPETERLHFYQLNKGAWPWVANGSNCETGIDGVEVSSVGTPLHESAGRRREA